MVIFQGISPKGTLTFPNALGSDSNQSLEWVNKVAFFMVPKSWIFNRIPHGISKDSLL
jgi:hypothetical protein